jgi:hypothetical protein
MNEIRRAGDDLKGLIAHYTSDPTDERAAYFRGLIAKAADSLAAIDMLLNSAGPIWTLHSRWIIEAFGYAAALNEDVNVLDQIKRLGANTYLLVADVDEATRKQLLDSISPTQLPNTRILLENFEKSVGVETGELYKAYRLLCEYSHFEFYRTLAYPALGVEPPEELQKRKDLFLKVTVATALSLPSFAHCPPSCGFDDNHFEKISALRDKAWRQVVPT